MMEVARTSEMSVDVYLTTRQYIPEESGLYNLNSICDEINISINTLNHSVKVLYPCVLSRNLRNKFI
jgi:hypothetical protein